MFQISAVIAIVSSQIDIYVYNSNISANITQTSMENNGLPASSVIVADSKAKIINIVNVSVKYSVLTSFMTSAMIVGYSSNDQAIIYVANITTFQAHLK